MGRRTWIKLYCHQWLRGHIRHLRNQERGVFIDLLVLAGDSAYGDAGEIKILENMGLTDAMYVELTGLKPHEWEDSKNILIANDMIEVLPNNIIRPVNWKKYQSEYQRQKPYRRK